MARGPDQTPPVGEASPTLLMPQEHFALICNGLYVEMHDSQRVGRPMHRRISYACVTRDITYAVYLREELWRCDGLESEIVRIRLSCDVST